MLPLFACLELPGNYDRVIITSLQAYSAEYTSMLLDLIGIGHHMDGTVINVPGVRSYGVEEACSGIVSFFTLLTVTLAFVVWARRVATPPRTWSYTLIILGLMGVAVDFFFGGLSLWSLPWISLFLMGLLGFHSSILLMSAVFWALFMNTARIFAIPVVEYLFDYNLSAGFSHELLGYLVLIIGILLVLSTDQFLLFLFSPVENMGDDSDRYGNTITRFWNGFLAASHNPELHASSKPQPTSKPVSQPTRMLIWTASVFMIIGGFYQIYDVQKIYANTEYKVRVFDKDATVDFEEKDLPNTIGEKWSLMDKGYTTTSRSFGSDLGQRSDIWQFRAKNYYATASLDQTFPGWHELTFCYKNTGWNLVSRKKINPEPTDGEITWPYIEAQFEKQTGEKGFLLFCHFDSFGEPVEAPQSWGKINSWIVRARNRLSPRLRARLFESSVYQNQVFLQSFNEPSDDIKNEVHEHFLLIRENLRQQFKKKRAAESDLE